MAALGSNPRHDAATGTNVSTGAAQPRASAHTAAQLHGWAQAGIERADLAIRRPDGAMLWHHDCPLADLPLAWARAHNVKQADVYLRPARGYAWPLVFLDDVTLHKARCIAAKYAAVVVHTSASGGCHVWLQVNAALDERQRYQAQRWLALRTGADLGSVSGEHLGRLAGMKNHKRNGVWVNVLDCANTHAPPWDPTSALQTPALQTTDDDNRCPVATSAHHASIGGDRSESAREWGWVCGALQAGISPDTVYRQLVARASPRRGQDAERYARYTIQRAIRQRR
jgi:hypothetical protein